ncbi:MAG: hypothetical protein JXB04_09620 [Kiritimatiellae bacterium]|nr:hypothetical protein [Kiritimatiellia bacterium]
MAASCCAVFVVALLAWAVPCVAQPAATNLNLFPNPSFEEPAGKEGLLPVNWDYYATKTKGGGISLAEAKSGQQSFRLPCQELKDAGQGLIRRLPVTEGVKYTFTAHVKEDRNEQLGGTAACQLVIEWINAADREVGRDAGKPERSLSRLRWERICIRKAKAPEGAVKAVFGIHLYEGSAGCRGAVLVDDVELVEE